MTAQHTSDYPTLGEVLRLPAFAGCIVCGGAAGLDRQVSGVNLTDTPDYARWLAQGELLITTGFALAIPIPTAMTPVPMRGTAIRLRAAGRTCWRRFPVGKLSTWV